MDYGTVTARQALEIISRLRERKVRGENGMPASVLRVHGSPLSGKSTLAFNALLAPSLADTVRQGSAVLISSHRTSADKLSEQIVQKLGTTREQRPAKTLPALAFRLLRDARREEGLSQPKLVNGAEEDAAITEVLQKHLAHVKAGDECSTCALLRHYLAVREALEAEKAQAEGRRESSTRPSAPGRDSRQDGADHGQNVPGDVDSVEAFEALLTPAFTAELRDMFARISELSLTRTALDAAEEDPTVTARQGDEWDLAFALRREYLAHLDEGSGLHRVDSSEIVVEACEAVRQGRVPEGRVPSFVVVDDCQDLTLAGYALLAALQKTGTTIVLIGCDDESVQTFRGAYPEVLSTLETAPLSRGGLGAATFTLEQKLDAAGSSDSPDGVDAESQEGGGAHKAHAQKHVDDGEEDHRDGGESASGEEPHGDTYRLTVASRVSRSIRPVLVPSTIPVPRRPGKLAPAQGVPDSTLQGRLFRSSEEENEDLVWQIRHLVGEHHAHYGDCAIIAHDNSVLQATGRALEAQGIPISYSSVTRPLKEIPVIRGLLGLLHLTADMRGHYFSDVSEVANRVRRVLATPLFSVAGAGSDPRPVRLEKIDSALDALSALSAITVENGPDMGEKGSEAGKNVSGQPASTNPAASEVPSVGVKDGERGGDRFAQIRVEADKLRQSAYQNGDNPNLEEAGSANSDAGDSANPHVASPVSADSPASGERAAGSVAQGESSGRVSDDELLVLLLAGSDAVRTQLASMLAMLSSSRWEARQAKRRNVTAQAARKAAPEAGEDSSASRTGGKVADGGADGNAPSGEDGEAPHDPDCDELFRLISIVRTCAAHKPGHGRLSTSIHAQLWDVWQATGVADQWQKQAVTPMPRGRAVNEWLDDVIRLFAHAQQAPAGQNVEDFLARMESLQIEADSLASLAPRPDSVILATPAGAAAVHVKYVWILSVQDGSWPNLSPRDALFDGQTLSAVVVRARLRAANALPQPDKPFGAIPQTGRTAQAPEDLSQDDEQQLLAAQDREERAELLATESKSFLVALTRGERQTVVSAISDEENLPSDFLLAFLPEVYGRHGIVQDTRQQNGEGLLGRQALEADDSDSSDSDGATYVADGTCYSKVGRDPTGADTELPWLGGLDSDPAGMAGAARLMLAAALSEQMDREEAGAADDTLDGGEEAAARRSQRRARLRQKIGDAVNALSLLARSGVKEADPSTWAFAGSARRLEHAQKAKQESIGQAGFDVTAARNAGLLRGMPSSPESGGTARPSASMRAGRRTSGRANSQSPAHIRAASPQSAHTQSEEGSRFEPAVPLSPSAVDAIWRCPLCWSLDNRFAGPQPTDASRSLGTVVHKVAQWATDTGVDRAVVSVEQMTDTLMNHYRQLMESAPHFSDPDQTFRLASGDASARTMLTRMARYFVDSRQPGYGEHEPKSKGGARLEGVGSLEEARAEVPFTAVFGIHDIGDYVRRTPGLARVSDHELFVVLSWLAAGFPQGTREDLRLRLSARIDRLERRGGLVWDILDWKTGVSSDVHTFSDLQLVCYQLGLTFSTTAGRRPAIERSVLFRLRLDEAPAVSHGLPELSFQPPIFTGDHLTTVYRPRPYLKTIGRAAVGSIGQMGHSALDDASPILLPRILADLNTADNQHSGAARGSAGSDQLPWDLAMIARVFYAGACLQTGVYPSRHGDDYTRYKEICPQWPVQSQTIYGRLHAARLVIGKDGRLTAIDPTVSPITPHTADSKNRSQSSSSQEER